MKVLVISNCQSYGLTNSMLQLAPSVSAAALPGQRLRNNDLPEGIEGQYDVIFGMEEFKENAANSFAADQFIAVPALYFDRFHPDVTGVMAGTTAVLSPTDAYHSLIGFAAYLNGRDAAGAVTAFNADTFEHAGYFAGWEAARNQLFADYEACGLDIRPEYLGWMRRGCFMLSHNHPKIHTLFSTARLILQKAGIPTLPLDECLLPDNLLNASVMPVYPEIAERIGMKGSYIFKRHGVTRAITLETFLQKSFAEYDKHDFSSLRVRQPMVSSLNRMKEYLG